MDSHLIAIEVGVERCAYQRVQLDRLALDQHGLEGLHTEPMKRWRAIEQHGMLSNHIGENVPDLRALALHHLPGSFNGRDIALLFQARIDEGLEELQGHPIRQTALMQTQLGTNNDHRAAGVINPLAQQVLPEAAALALQHIRE